jgi:hypothetical protein
MDVCLKAWKLGIRCRTRGVKLHAIKTVDGSTAAYFYLTRSQLTQVRPSNEPVVKLLLHLAMICYRGELGLSTLKPMGDSTIQAGARPVRGQGKLECSGLVPCILQNLQFRFETELHA